MKANLWVVLAAAIGLAPAATAQPASPVPAPPVTVQPPPLCTFNSGAAMTVKLGAKPIDLAVELHDPPTGRTRLTIESDHGRRELEWDPAADSHQVQHVMLGTGIGTWTVSPWVETTNLQSGAATSIARTAGYALTSGNDTTTIVGRYQLLSAAGSAASTAITAPSFTLTCTAAPTIGATRYAPAAAPAANTRSLLGGTVPEALAQTLSMLAEIAINRAKAGALSVLKDQFVVPLCGEPPGTPADPKHPGVTLKVLGLPGTGLALPKTCALLQQLQLQDVLSSGKPLLADVEDDLRQTIAPGAAKVLARRLQIGGLSQLLVGLLGVANHAIDQGTFTVADAEQALDLAASFAMGPIVDPAARRQLIAAISTASGTGSGACDAACAEAELDATASDADVIALLTGLKLDPTKSPLRDEVDSFEMLVDLPVGAGSAATTVPAIIATALGVANAPAPATFRACRGITDLAKCGIAIARSVHTLDDLDAVVTKLAIANDAMTAALSAQILKNPTLEHATEAVCESRLAVAIVRKCSAGGCAPDDIANMLAAPQSYFTVDTALPGALCWIGTGAAARYNNADVAGTGDYQQFIADGLDLIAATKLTDLQRAVVVLKMVSRYIHDSAGCGTANPADANTSVTCAAIDDMSSVIIALAQSDYTAALTSGFALIQKIATDAESAGYMYKGAQLIGSVAAYVQVFESTKTAPADAARAAREQALENIINAATDRHGRGGDWIVSLGSNVGAGYTWTQPRASSQADSSAVQVRVPIGIAIDRLPNGTGFCDSFGVHFGATIGDLGQFAAVGADGKVQPVRWDNFLSPGVELGFLFGKPQNNLNVSFHVEYAPILMSDSSSSGALRFGVTLGYDVPFFDFN